MTLKKTILLAGALGVCLALFGCGGKEFTYAPDRGLMKGRGIFSGEDGEFVLIDKKITKTEETQTTVETEKETDETP